MIVVIQKYDWDRDGNFAYPTNSYYAATHEEADFLIAEATRIEKTQEEFNHDVGSFAGFYPQYIKEEVERFADYLAIKM